VDKKATHLDLKRAKLFVNEACDNYRINSMMTFGGEPLLYPEFVCELHKTAEERNIENRQIITNAYWTKNGKRIDEIARMLKDSGVNDILVSIDYFHEKYLDYDIVGIALEQLKKQNIPHVSLHPVWVVNKESKNSYNEKTKELLKMFDYLDFPQDEGNNLFPAGRAVNNFKEYLPTPTEKIVGNCGDLPYTEKPNNLKCLSMNPNGEIMGCNVIGNIYKSSLTEIISRYDYKNDIVLKSIVEEGCSGLYNLVKEKNIELNKNGYYSICDLCKDIRAKMLLHR
jgi:sulfatase maturation enzyme AslB (radical SAM superfamily)